MSEPEHEGKRSWVSPPRFYALFLCCIIMILVNKVHLKMGECRLMVLMVVIIFSVTLGNSPMS